MTFSEVLDRYVEEDTRLKGFSYFQENRIKKFKFDDNRVEATVKGTKEYYVEVKFTKRGHPNWLLCTCPSSGVCKHIAAVFYKLNYAGFWGETTPPAGLFERENPLNIKELDKDSFENIQQGNLDQMLNKLKDTDEELRFIEFQSRFQTFSTPVQAKGKENNFKIGYAVQLRMLSASIYIIKQTLDSNGDVISREIWNNPDISLLSNISFEEKLLIRHFEKNDNRFTIYFFSSPGQIKSRDQVEQSAVFSGMLEFLADKEVFLYSGSEIQEKIEILKKSGSAKIHIGENEKGLELKPVFEIEGITGGLDGKVFTVVDSPLWVYSNSKIFRISNMTYEQMKIFSGQENGAEVPAEYLHYFEEQILPGLTKNIPIVSDKYEIRESADKPQKRIYLNEEDGELVLELKFAYGNEVLPYDPQSNLSQVFTGNIITAISRDKVYEEDAADSIRETTVREREPGVFIPKREPVAYLFDYLPKLKEEGFEIFGQQKLSRYKVNTAAPAFGISISSGIDWFDVDTTIKYGDVPVQIETLLKAVRQKKSFIRLDDGSTALLPDELAEKLSRAFAFGEVREGKLRFNRHQAAAVEMLAREAEQVQEDEQFRQYIENLHSFEKIKYQQVPEGFDGELREYQKAGFDWFYFLQEYHFGGILADDMGLGKTIQVLALLLNEQSKSLPNLVVAPTSVVFNWMNEAAKFTPGLKILNHTGTSRIKETAGHFEDYDLVVTSYGVLLRDIDNLSGIDFNYIVLDESQKIKNPFSQSARSVRLLKGRNRLCLTGTPVENNLNELWSQMSFVNPGLLGSLNKFQELFVRPIQKSENPDSSGYLKKVLYPFILRRTKDVVAKELPPKTEIIHYCEMDAEQEKIYEMWRGAIRDDILKEIEINGVRKSGFKIIEGLLRLRQICNHPLLVKEGYNRHSGKYEEFKDLLSEVVEEGHKVLVFSQFVKMLEIMRGHLDKKGIKYEYLTGSVKDREERVNNFQNNDQVKVFLISLKAGGFGLNLTAADYVFHYDPWWNPAVEQQATDRAHRIGQDKNVMIYKFITKDSVEEKILQLQNKKKELADSIISEEGGLLKTLSREDIEALFG